MKSLHLQRKLGAGDKAYMSWVRGQNNMNSKKLEIEQDGTVEFKERVEMQTMILAGK
jgi:hypothetical protein